MEDGQSLWQAKVNGVWTRIEGTIIAKRFISSPIARVPPQGYSRGNAFSKSSIQYWEWLMHKEKSKGRTLYLRHATNHPDGEYKVGSYRVDAYDRATHTIIEYLGCSFHGCISCAPDRRQRSPHNRHTMDELFAMTLQRKKFFLNQGFQYKEVWEHEVLAKKRRDPEMKAFMDSVDVQPRLSPRDCFYGGRTNATRLYLAVESPATIRYIDVCSLYPWAQKLVTLTLTLILM